MVKNTLTKIGLGGGCHWCTEAVFLSLKGVKNVQQGWIASKKPHESFSEAVIVEFDISEISLKDLIAIHLHTHQSTSNHSMRKKYRSAVYYFSLEDEKLIKMILNDLQNDFDVELITKALPFSAFKSSLEEHLNYYYKNPEKPFCKTYINPKLSFLLKNYTHHLK
ncbi:peptide methionine sulfoxide reductase [Flavobacteriaceae bacterium R38]|nr:peptide methionine sulfoxide reductase [Flavobacteriaceae bacterium R38]